MRRREPDCMRIADDKPTDKKRFADVYGYKFDKLRHGRHGNALAVFDHVGQFL